MLAICTLALLAARGNLCVARHLPNSRTGSVRHNCEVLGFCPYFHLSRHSFTFRAFLRAFDRLLWARGAPKFVGDAAPIRPSFLNPAPVKTADDRHEVEHSNSRFESILFDSLCESIRIDSFGKKIGLSIH